MPYLYRDRSEWIYEWTIHVFISRNCMNRLMNRINMYHWIVLRCAECLGHPEANCLNDDTNRGAIKTFQSAREWQRESRRARERKRIGLFSHGIVRFDQNDILLLLLVIDIAFFFIGLWNMRWACIFCQNFIRVNQFIVLFVHINTPEMNALHITVNKCIVRSDTQRFLSFGCSLQSNVSLDAHAMSCVIGAGSSVWYVIVAINIIIWYILLNTLERRIGKNCSDGIVAVHVPFHSRVRGAQNQSNDK